MLNMYLHLVKDLQRVLQYFNEVMVLSEIIFHAAGLTPDPKSFLDVLIPKPVYYCLSRFQINSDLSLPLVKRIAPWDIRRCIKHGSILPWIYTISSRAEFLILLPVVEEGKVKIFVSKDISVVGRLWKQFWAGSAQTR